MHGVSWEEGTSFPFVKQPAGFISPLQSLLLQAPLFKPPSPSPGDSSISLLR